ncbi:MAG: RDD family protein [Campylobacterota bacterium]
MNNKVSSNDMQNLQLATFWPRIKAYIIDDILITFITALIFWEQIKSAGDDMASVMAVLNVYLIPIMFLKISYHTFFIWYYGATVGKYLSKIRVIDHDTLSNISFISSLVRAVARILSEMFFYLGFIFAFFNEARQTFQDKIAKTLVVNA